ncbi:MAG: serine/threonine-protein kinase, partial [Armatimonadota bacterium]
MGAVFLATDSALDRSVAIKVLPPELSHDENFVKRFEHEARTAAKLDHPSIIPIFAVEGQADLHYFVMKYVIGRGLDEILESGPMPVELVQHILWEAACALGHAHQRGIAHRDIKPANIMLDDQGRTMLADFGISKALESASQFTATGQVIGTPHYMSPEQAKGQEVDGRTDQYSLAVVGYRMLAGRLPFDDQSVHTVIYKHIFEDPPPLTSFRSDVPADLAKALHKAMAKDPDHRFPTMEEFATAVWPEHPVARPSGSAAFPTRPVVSSIDAAVTEVTPTPAPSKRGRRAAAAGITLLLLGAGAGGAWWVFGGGMGVLDRGTVEPPATTPGAISDSLRAGEAAP